MKDRQKNRMESIALFEEKIPLTPRDLSKSKIDVEKLLTQKLAEKLEGKCSLHGYVVPGSVRLLSRSVGYVENGRYTADIVYHTQCEGQVIYPPDGTRLECEVERKNKMGMFVKYKDAIRIILPRDLHIGEDALSVEFNDVQPGEIIQVEIKKSRFQVNDPYILSVGLYLGRSGKTAVQGVKAAERRDDALPVGVKREGPATKRGLNEREKAILAIKTSMAKILNEGKTTEDLPSRREGTKIFVSLPIQAAAADLKLLDGDFEAMQFTPNGFYTSSDEAVYNRDAMKLVKLLDSSGNQPTEEEDDAEEEGSEENEEEEEIDI